MRKTDKKGAISSDMVVYILLAVLVLVIVLVLVFSSGSASRILDLFGSKITVESMKTKCQGLVTRDAFSYCCNAEDVYFNKDQKLPERQTCHSLFDPQNVVSNAPVCDVANCLGNACAIDKVMDKSKCAAKDIDEKTTVNINLVPIAYGEVCCKKALVVTPNTRTTTCGAYEYDTTNNPGVTGKLCNDDGLECSAPSDKITPPANTVFSDVVTGKICCKVDCVVAP